MDCLLVETGCLLTGTFLGMFCSERGICMLVSCLVCIAWHFIGRSLALRRAGLEFFFATVDEKSSRYDQAAAVPVVNYLSQ